MTQYIATWDNPCLHTSRRRIKSAKAVQEAVKGIASLRKAAAEKQLITEFSIYINTTSREQQYVVHRACDTCESHIC